MEKLMSRNVLATLLAVVDLFYMQDADLRQYFFIEKDGIMYELSNQEKTVYLGDETHSVKTNKYIGQLNYALGGPHMPTSKIYNARLNHLSLISLVKDYHEAVCDSAECVVCYRKQKKLNDANWDIRFGVSAGLGYSVFTTKNKLWGQAVFYLEPGCLADLAVFILAKNRPASIF